jgi:hypothetical protein
MYSECNTGINRNFTISCPVYRDLKIKRKLILYLAASELNA